MEKFEQLRVLVIVLFCSVQLGHAACPTECRCHNAVLGIVVDCSGLGLHQMPDIRSIRQPIFQLNVSKNNIREIPLHYFSDSPNISELILDENQITELTPNSFTGLGPFRLLSLKNNQLSNVDAYTFRELSGSSCTEDTQGCVLDLTHNPVDYVYAYAFAYAKNLSILLGHSHQELTIEPYAFYGVTDISKILISDVPKLNLKAGAFTNAEKVTLLEISNTVMDSITRFTFKGMINVNTIHIHDTSLPDIQDYGFAGIHYQSTSLDMAKAESSQLQTVNVHNRASYDHSGGTVHIESCQINILPPDCFRDTNLAKILLEGNTILSIKEHFLRGATKLRTVALEENILYTLKARSLGSAKSIKQVRLIRNDLKDIHKSSFEGLENVKALIIHLKSGSHLTLHSGAFSGARDIGSLQIIGDSASNLASMSVLEDAFQNLFGIQSFDIININMPTLTQGSFRGMGKVRTLRFLACNIHTIESRTFGPGYYGRRAVDHLDLSTGNFLKCDCDLSTLIKELEDVFLNVTLTCTSSGGVQQTATYNARSTSDITKWPACPYTGSGQRPLHTLLSSLLVCLSMMYIFV